MRVAALDSSKRPTHAGSTVAGTKDRTKDELDELMQFSRFGLNDEDQIESDIVYQIRKWKNTKGKIMDLTRAYSAEEVRENLRKKWKTFSWGGSAHHDRDS